MERAPSSMPEMDPREQALARTLGVHDLTARVLLARGLDDPAAARSHLRPDLRSMNDPFEFTQMDQAVERVKSAIRNGEKIMIHGDYDVDGVTGTVLLVKFFSLMSADVHPFIPARADGYSLTDASVAAVRDGAFKLLISVDNGTNARDAIQAIQGQGCDVLVTDHHGTSEGVAPAHTVLNPRLPDAGYPDRDLAGVGVAFKLAAAVAKSFSQGKSLSREFREFLVEAMSLVALGTIADVAPLRGENRVMVFHGLRALASSSNPGIRALIDSAGLGDRAPTPEDISFRIAPLINAAGRMGSALEAVELLMAPGYHEAQQAATALEKHNKNRRQVEKDVVQQATAIAETMDDDVLVIGGDDWHRGVLGIVAARIAERTGKPAILLSFEGDIGRGSGRSTDGFHLRNALSECTDSLINYGGHHAAVGLELHRDSLDELRRRINQVAAAQDSPTLSLEVDGAAELAELDSREIRELEEFGPFGAGNRRPVFVTDGLTLLGNPVVDARGNDLRFRVVKDGVILPVRLHNGARQFERIRNHDGPVSLVYSPRLAPWADEGPIYLHSWQIRAASDEESLSS